MAPGRAELFESGELANYYEQLHALVDTIVSEQSTESSPIITVDMYSDFREDYLADDVHYNERGADFIASRYYEVLVDLLQD
jgi:lysophospholipase L1-like esterase